MSRSLPKKASFTRRFTDLIKEKSNRRPSSRDGAKDEGLVTPPQQITTPSPSSSTSSPLSLQSQATSLSPKSARYTFDEQHRLPVTFLPFVNTDNSFLKGLDDMLGESNNRSRKSSFEFNQSPVEGEENWYSMSDDQSSSFGTLESRTRSQSKSTLQSPTKSIAIGWICEDGFKPIGGFE